MPGRGTGVGTSPGPSRPRAAAEVRAAQLVLARIALVHPQVSRNATAQLWALHEVLNALGIGARVVCEDDAEVDGKFS